MSGDPELDAMSTVSGALSPLDPEVQGRVLRWAAERFGVKLGTARRTGTSPDGAESESDSDSTDGSEAASEGSSEFQHFAEFFAAAAPTSDADKALVAGYWLQVFEGKEGWFSRSLNMELRHLGHASGNITRALQANIDARPQLVIQLKKSGNSRQSKKTYKVTGEGIKYVRSMLNAGAD